MNDIIPERKTYKDILREIEKEDESFALIIDEKDFKILRNDLVKNNLKNISSLRLLELLHKERYYDSEMLAVNIPIGGNSCIDCKSKNIIKFQLPNQIIVKCNDCKEVNVWRKEISSNRMKAFLKKVKK
jgi:hypothetical protein